jgi:hypothetical protein
MVRAAAVRFLGTHHAAEDLPVLIGNVRRNADEYVREHVALIIGKIGNSASVGPLQQALQTEPEVHARHAISLALARLGDEPSRTALLARLHTDDIQERVSALQDLLYLEDQRLASEVLPLLDDMRDAKNVAPSHGSYWIRVCDVALNTLDELLGHPFPFPVSRAQRYTPEQLAQAKSIVRGQR